MGLIITKVVFITSAIALGILVLLQQSKGAGMGLSVGGAGASSTVFGARGANSFLYKLIRALAVVFFASALTMGYLQNKEATSGSILQKDIAEPTLSEPAKSVSNSATSTSTPNEPVQNTGSLAPTNVNSDGSTLPKQEKASEQKQDASEQ